jgi:hypothetical protein
MYSRNDISDSLNVFLRLYGFNRFVKHKIVSIHNKISLLSLTILSGSESIRISRHDPKFLVNYSDGCLTHLSSSRIINYRKSISTIESSITIESSPRLSKVIFRYLSSRSPTFVWLDPRSGNKEPPSVEIKG